MAKKLFVYILAFQVIILVSSEYGFAQDEKLICDNVHLTLKYYFSENSESKICNYKAFVFSNDKDLDSLTLAGIGNAIFTKVAGKALKPESVLILKTIDGYYLVTLFKNHKFNELNFKESKIDLSNYKNRISEIKSKELYSYVFLYYAKKYFENLDKVKTSNDIKIKLATLSNYLDSLVISNKNGVFYELNAYRYYYEKEIYNSPCEIDIDSCFNQSLNMGNKDSIFLRNYTMWNYKNAYGIYLKDNLNTEDYENILNRFEIVNKFGNNKDTIYTNTSYLILYCKYKLYDRSDSKRNIDLDSAANDFRKSEGALDSNTKYFCDSKLYLGNIYLKLNDHYNAKKYYEEIISGTKCSEEYKKIAKINLKKLEH